MTSVIDLLQEIRVLKKMRISWCFTITRLGQDWHELAWVRRDCVACGRWALGFRVLKKKKENNVWLRPGVWCPLACLKRMHFSRSKLLPSWRLKISSWLFSNSYIFTSFTDDEKVCESLAIRPFGSTLCGWNTLRPIDNSKFVPTKGGVLSIEKNSPCGTSSAQSPMLSAN